MIASCKAHNAITISIPPFKTTLSTVLFVTLQFLHYQAIQQMEVKCPNLDEIFRPIWNLFPSFSSWQALFQLLTNNRKKNKTHQASKFCNMHRKTLIF